MDPNNPAGNFNPNANSYVPRQPGQPFYPQQQQPQQYYQQQQFYPQQQQLYQQQQTQWGYQTNNSYGGWAPPQAGGNAGGQYPPVQQPYAGNRGPYAPPQHQKLKRGDFQNTRGDGRSPIVSNADVSNCDNHSPSPPRQLQRPTSQPTSPPISTLDPASPSLNNSSTQQLAAPAPASRKGGAVLSVGTKQKQQKANEDAKGAEAAATPTEGNTVESRAAPWQPVKNAPTTQEELRESVRKEIARQREQRTKQFVRDPRPHFNIVFCGHVDAGKSTISGHLLMEKGLVDQREMAKLRRKAEAHHREGWEYAYVMDVSEEEQSKGITRETGAAYIETEKRRITILDAPGHKAFVPSMIGGATQADVCVLVISSRTGEFETGFERGGQTREHTTLVRTCGVKQMICVINKMDEMKWSKERHDEIVGKLRPFLRQNGYDEKSKNLVFIPTAGFTGDNLIKHTDASLCPWYTGPTMMEVIDELKLPESKSEDDVLCIPLVGSYKDDGKTFIYGKVESGSIAVGEKIQVLPSKLEALVEGVSIESTEFEKCYPGDNVHLRVRGIDETDIHSGYVATSIPTSMRAVEFIQARVVVLEVKNIISAGYRFMIHIHASQEEASFHKLLAKLDRRTGEMIEKNPVCAKAGDVLMVRIELDRSIVCEAHKDFDKMGRFILREDGKTFAIGLITKLYESTRESLGKDKLN